MRYHLRVMDAAQQVQTLTLDALDEADARSQALARRLTPLSVARAGGWSAPRRSAFDLLLFAQEMHALLAAGLSVIEALEVLIDKEPAATRQAVLTRLCQQLREGQRLSGAMAQQPAVFPPLFVGVVQSAEGTSDLPRALSRFIDYETRLDLIRQRVVSASIYPSILVVAGLAVSLFLLGYVVPRFASVYQGSGRSLPWASQLLLDWGQFAADHALALGLGLATAAVLVAGWVRGQLASGGWWRLLRVLPGARPRIEVLELSRLYLTLGMLLEGGVTVPQALTLCTAVLAPGRQAALVAVRTAVESGEAMSDALQRHGLATPVALRLLRVGERSGQLGAMLGRAAAFHDADTSRWIERFTRSFEPLLMAAIGVVIGLIVILLYMPVFELAGSLR